jgi:hypothetical protein
MGDMEYELDCLLITSDGTASVCEDICEVTPGGAYIRGLIWHTFNGMAISSLNVHFNGATFRALLTLREHIAEHSAEPECGPDGARPVWFNFGDDEWYSPSQALAVVNAVIEVTPKDHG